MKQAKLRGASPNLFLGGDGPWPHDECCLSRRNYRKQNQKEPMVMFTRSKGLKTVWKKPFTEHPQRREARCWPLILRAVSTPLRSIVAPSLVSKGCLKTGFTQSALLQFQCSINFLPKFIYHYLPKSPELTYPDDALPSHHHGQGVGENWWEGSKEQYLGVTLTSSTVQLWPSLAAAIWGHCLFSGSLSSPLPRTTEYLMSYLK